MKFLKDSMCIIHMIILYNCTSVNKLQLSCKLLFYDINQSDSVTSVLLLLWRWSHIAIAHSFYLSVKIDYFMLSVLTSNRVKHAIETIIDYCLAFQKTEILQFSFSEINIIVNEKLKCCFSWFGDLSIIFCLNCIINKKNKIFCSQTTIRSAF